MALAAENQRLTRGRPPVRDVGFARRRQRGDGKFVPVQGGDARVHGWRTKKRHAQDPADGDAHGFSIERIAALRIEDHGIGAEGGGVAEDRSHIVMI